MVKKHTCNLISQLVIIDGPDAWAQIENSGFVADWRNLGERDPKFTIYQEPPFVIAWYRIHGDIFEPVFCLGRDHIGGLVGVMSLARRRSDGALVHAGDFHAEYHGWVAKSECDQSFAEECLIALQGRYRLKRWRWNFLPRGTPPGLLNSSRLAGHGISCRVRIEASPLLDLTDDEHLLRLLKTKSIRNQINRYKKRGNFRLERIENIEQAARLFRVLRAQNDFRQEAVHGNRPFGDNPLKEPFFLERLKIPQANHFSVLMCDETPLSFHFGPCDRDTLVLGLTAFDPSESRNSPGKLHLIELAHMLKHEGFRRIDLTPGGDSYKEFLANGSLVLQQPTFYFTRVGKAVADMGWGIRQTIKRLLACASIPSERVPNALHIATGLLRKIRKITPTKLMCRMKKVIHEAHTYFQFCYDPETTLDPDDDPDVHVQCYGDLLTYDGFNPWLSRRELLSAAFTRFSAGETLYTICRDGNLVHYGWLAPGGRLHFLEGVDAVFRSPDKSIVLYDFFTHPTYRGQGLYQQNLRQMLRDLRRTETGLIFIGVLNDNQPSRRIIEKLGFKLVKIYSKRRFLFKCNYHLEDPRL